MKISPNEQYNIAEADSLAVKLAGYQRRRMYKRFMSVANPTPNDRLLDIGATSERTYSSSNYLEKWYPHKASLTAVGLDDARFLEDEYPGMRYIRADGRDLPFEDDSFDFVHSSAVIEHVGSFGQQVALISECARVARKGFFLTTPNRWFPVEFHTVTPLLHWLPPTIFRGMMRRIGREFFAEESNLNLMSRRSLRYAAKTSGAGKKFRIKVATVSLAGWPSNLLLIGERTN